ncbi:hypothetical protein [Streptomyces sp. Da 82-17]|uniref:hypothetical protein n=1 Tax=Streptomyces sp. Da 82-17 TaxID=3377116 RepID=UPI0038D3EA06
MEVDQIARRFPLVARPRPACRPLAERVQEITDLARSAERDANLQPAAVAQNLAALIASDCGLPDLARTLCWRHAELYLHAGRPLSLQEARYGLEPLVNLARLHIRNGAGEAAYELLDHLNTAVRERGGTIIDDRTLSFQNLTATEEDHHKLCQWLWAVLLGDGTRALVAAGHWERALRHVEHHKGIGNRLLDGRQVQVVARCLGGELTSAMSVLASSTLSADWERAVAASLSALCLTKAGIRRTDLPSDLAQNFLKLELGPELVLFGARLGLVVWDLCETDRTAARHAVCDRLLYLAEKFQDGYAARELLGHAGTQHRMSPGQREAFNHAVIAAGLQQHQIPDELEYALQSAAETCAAVTRQLVAKSPKRGRVRI